MYYVSVEATMCSFLHGNTPQEASPWWITTFVRLLPVLPAAKSINSSFMSVATWIYHLEKTHSQ